MTIQKIDGSQLLANATPWVPEGEIGEQGPLPPEFTDVGLFRQLVAEQLQGVGKDLPMESLVQQMVDLFAASRTQMLQNGLTAEDREAAFFCTTASLAVKNLVLNVKLLMKEGMTQDAALAQAMAEGA